MRECENVTLQPSHENKSCSPCRKRLSERVFWRFCINVGCSLDLLPNFQNKQSGCGRKPGRILNHGP